MKTVNREKPKYLFVYEKMKKSIIEGTFKYGEKLPSKRVLADRYGVSVITSERAYELLISEGYVTSVQKSGYFCEYKGLDRFMAAVNEEPPFFIKNTENPAGFPFPLYAKTVRKVLSLYDSSTLSKCSGTGSDFLKSEICSYLLRSRGIKTTPRNIVIGAGAEYLYGLILELLGRDKIYAAEDPSYEKIEQVYKSKGAVCEMLPLSNSGIKSAALKKCKAQILHITPYRSYPSGVTASASKRNEYIDWSKTNNRYIIEDDFESEFTHTGKIYDTVYSLSPYNNVIYLNTFSRTVSPAIRTAFMVLPDNLSKKFQKKLGFYSCTVPTLEQFVLAEILRTGVFEQHINRQRRIIRQERKSKCTE
ncbi:MAG: PLP-dependent aminotransferase family protein [Clostridia bacterium]|nr:PLP-dependent aminotransferase family protein [Clostridia bacterium]